MVLAAERRTSPRTDPGALGCNLLIMVESAGWMRPGKLLNISAGGALIRSDRGITEQRRLRILIHDVPELGWIDAEVVRSDEPRELAVRFITPFSPEFVQAATTEPRSSREGRAESQTPYLGDAIPIW